MRSVRGLKWARSCERPSFVHNGPKRGVKRQGIRYENAFAGALSAEFPQAKHGQWWEFEDDNGRGFCQTDVLLTGPQAAVVFECKLSLVAEAFVQLSDLYLPVVQRALALPASGIVVTRHLRRGSGAPIVAQLSEALLIAPTEIPILHWLERTPL